MIDRSLIGKTYPPFYSDVTEEKIRLFAKATGQTNPIHFLIKSAQKEGYPSLLAPLTFLTTVSYEQEDPYKYLKDLNIELGQFLHANQEYTYFSPVCAGDRIKMESKLSDLFDKRGGRLQFLVFRSTYTNQDKVIVAKSKTTLVVR